jgi:hypothetical protein
MSENFVWLLEKAKAEIDNPYGYTNEFGEYTIRIPMKELEEIDDLEWDFWVYKIISIIKGEEERKDFEENGAIEYSFDLRYRGTSTTAYDSKGQEIVFGSTQYWKEVSDEEFNFWEKLLKWLIQKDKALDNGSNHVHIS